MAIQSKQLTPTLAVHITSAFDPSINKWVNSMNMNDEETHPVTQEFDTEEAALKHGREFLDSMDGAANYMTELFTKILAVVPRA